MLYRRRLSQALAIVFLLGTATLAGYAIATLLAPDQALPTTADNFGTTAPPRGPAVLGVSDDLEAPPAPVPALPAAPLPESASPADDARSLTEMLTEQGLLDPAAERVVADSFDDRSSGWIERAAPTWSAGYIHGQYQITLTGQPALNMASPLEPGDYRLTADVAVEQGSAGLVFLAAKPATFYRFVISADGQFALQRQDGDASADVVAWTPSSALTGAAGASHRLVVELAGDQVRFLIDDQLALTWPVPAEPVVSQYGLAVAAADNMAVATFDNLVAERSVR